ncbi:NOG1 family protein [Sulfurisphaera tokodaii]|uniref:GTP-binding protein n=2 Tax=Sulfurisphaera tokodaii TaxID=111955 RepID=Q970W1_SULTO|nr:GTPase [Sulfurisphaera tokodaii]BAB66562.1 putative GTP-binding protein [Sulfurisphaera tokodaii str. 7]HII73622.1 GTP-binding protein [Sulfurisphaera tokodaii]
MLNPFENIKIPPKTEDLIKIVLDRIPKIGGKNVKEREIKRILFYKEQLQKYRDFVLQFPRIDQLHPFYRENIEIIADIDKVKMCLGAINRGVQLSFNIIERYRRLIKSSDEKEANRLMRQCFGRVSSILRSRKDCIDWLIDITSQLKKLKAIDPNLPTIIIAGPPNVGKSTLVSKISSAKPEVASYPFTTKEIHVGHIDTGIVKIQVIDTPGILDRPMSERNSIELKAINAIKNLNGIILFLFDVSNSSIYSAKEQLDLYKEVKSIKSVVIPVLNKIDDKNEELYKQIKENILEKVFEISAEKNIGLDTLLNYVINLLQNGQILDKRDIYLNSG